MIVLHTNLHTKLYIIYVHLLPFITGKYIFIYVKIMINQLN